MQLDTKVTELSGVGKARAEALGKLGIFTLKDLIFFYPRAYEYRGDVRLLGEYKLELPCSYVLTVATEPTNVKLKNRMTMSKFRAFDDSGSVEIIFFNSPYVKDVFHTGCVFRFYGKASFSKNKRLNLINPKYEPIIEGVPLDDFAPRYSLSDGIPEKTFEKLIKSALQECLPLIEDYLPENIRLKYSLATLGYAVKHIHTPESHDALKRARDRLAFDEMLMFALGISLSRAKRERTSGVPFSPTSLEPFCNLLPYELTPSQKSAINDIYRDTVLKKEGEITPVMSRIIVGDVGCGKTVCAAAAIYLSKCSGYQSALLVPTEILAVQHYRDMSQLLGSLGARVELLTGSTTPKEKRRIYAGLSDGSIDVVIGTHAIIVDKVEFSRLGLVITDEQHRFGVAQRGALKDKSHDAHMLVMSATPIPRTLALALYGDLDISRITDMPKGRTRVDTFVVNESYRARLNSFIEKQIALGGQCYIVCPAIERTEDDEGTILLEEFGTESLHSYGENNLKNAIEHTDALRSAMPNLKIECLHGRMKNAEKDEIMRRFSAGEINVLVSTTVIEVGVNVPNASLMIVENAERFGLSQLHQLRGRVGRGQRKSYCVLVSDLNSEKSKARLEVMRTTYDGFEIADKDLILRGPGDFFSQNATDNIRQSGGFEFKLASMCDDKILFENAFAAAKGIASADPELAMPEHAPLKSLIASSISPSTIS